MTDRQTDSSKPTSGAEWRRMQRAEYTITLPSGNVATIRPLLLDRLIAQEQIPDVLTPWAARALWAVSDVQSIAEQVETARGFADLVGWVVKAAMVDPKVVDDPQADDEISLDDIHFRDKFKVFDLATEPAAWLKSFRDQQTQRLEALQHRNQDGQPAQSNITDP